MIKTTAAEQAIRERIEARGRITFAEFMQTALYHPVDGYYTSESPFGATGDYYTSPAVHPAFGALLAKQLFGMWRGMGKPSDFTVVEMGSGNGLLANDICSYASEISDEFFRRLNYICIDRYSLADADIAGMPGITRILADELPLRDVVGCFLSNEFADAFSVHRFQIDSGEVLEVYVTLDDAGNFHEELATPSTPLIEEMLDRLGIALADGHKGEVNLNVKPWLADVVEALATGFLITVDYGYEAAELHSQSRQFGTLQTYYRHTEGSSPYQRIGRQDITAHVDFSLLREEGSAVGLATLEYTTQSEFLTSLGIGEMMRQLRESPLGHHERSANTMALRELLKADGLGGFGVLVQEKATGLTSMPPIKSIGGKSRMPTVPLLSSRHMPLMEGRYPQTSWEMPSLWGETGYDAR